MNAADLDAIEVRARALVDDPHPLTAWVANEAVELVAECRRLGGENTQLRTALTELIETGNEACQFPDGESVKRFDKAMMAARVALGENEQWP